MPAVQMLASQILEKSTQGTNTLAAPLDEVALGAAAEEREALICASSGMAAFPVAVAMAVSAVATVNDTVLVTSGGGVLVLAGAVLTPDTAAATPVGPASTVTTSGSPGFRLA